MTDATYKIVRFGIPDTGSYALALSGHRASPELVQEISLNTYRKFGLAQEDFNPAHTPEYLGRSGNNHYFEIQVEAAKADALKGHAGTGLVCAPEELSGIFDRSARKKYRDVVFNHHSQIARRGDETAHDAITRTALEKFAASGITHEHISPEHKSSPGSGNRFIVWLEETKADALESSGHRDVVAPVRKKAGGPGF